MKKIQYLEEDHNQSIITLTELQNYAKSSEKWIQDNEAKLNKLQENVSSNFATKDELTSFATKDVWLKYVSENNVSIDDLSNRIDKLESVLSKLKKITK